MAKEADQRGWSMNTCSGLAGLGARMKGTERVTRRFVNVGVRLVSLGPGGAGGRSGMRGTGTQTPVLGKYTGLSKLLGLVQWRSDGLGVRLVRKGVRG